MATLTLSPAREIFALGLDVDGVIRDTGYHAYEVMCKTLVELGGTVPTFDTFVHGYTTDVVTFYGECGVCCGLEKILSVYRKHSAGHHDDCAPYRDVARFLNYLSVLEVRMFAISSHPHAQIVEWFTTHRIGAYFSHVAGSSIDKAVCLTEACNTIKVLPHKACYVGDWGADMRAAATAGLIPIGITRGYDSRSALVKSGANYVVEHLTDLIAAIN
jgi:phosphoglycolate phosphatase